MVRCKYCKGRIKKGTAPAYSKPEWLNTMTGSYCAKARYGKGLQGNSGYYHIPDETYQVRLILERYDNS